MEEDTAACVLVRGSALFSRLLAARRPDRASLRFGSLPRWRYPNGYRWVTIRFPALTAKPGRKKEESGLH